MAAKEDKPQAKVTSPEVQELEVLYQMMLEKGLDSVELKNEDSRIKLSRHLAPPAGFHEPGRKHADFARSTGASHLPDGVPSAPKANATAPEALPPGTIASPLAGVFYRASSPTSAPFAKEGDVVDSGVTLCIVEAMKVMNEIKSENRCRIVKILAENGRPVTAGQALFATETETETA